MPRRPGILHARTRDGAELPVVDVTHPAFSTEAEERSLAEATRAYFEEEERRARMPVLLLRFFHRIALRRSALARAIRAADGTFLPGLPTYVLKLGPENLDPSYGDLDRRIAGSLPVVSLRLRLRDMAELLAAGLARALARAPEEARIHLLNIGGGPAIDSLNALILLRRRADLAARETAIHVLDLDDAGPFFGRAALEALSAPEAPLHGLRVGFDHRRYDWSDTTVLRGVLDAEIGEGDVVACSSEGALFDYGSDEEVARNLRALHDGRSPASFVVGSATRADSARRTARLSRPATRPRDRAGLEALCRGAGWILEEVRERPFSYDVRLART